MFILLFLFKFIKINIYVLENSKYIQYINDVIYLIVFYFK